MKEGFICGVLFGALAGMIIYRYSTDVQKLAEDTVKRVREQLSKSKDYASEEIHMEYLKDAMKNKGIVTGNLGENTGSSITDREADIINLLRSLTGSR